MSPNPDPKARTALSETTSSPRTMRWQAFSGKLWALSTYLYKQKIYWQDRFGCFRYQDWIKTVEIRRIKNTLGQGSGQPSLAPSVCFVLSLDTKNSVDVLETLNALHQSASGSPVILFLPKNSPHLQADWLRDRIKQNGLISVIETDQPRSPGGWIPLAHQIPADWVISLRPGDRIAPFWELMFTRFAAKNAQAQLIYWDEDSLDEKNRRVRPFFKPDWSPELLFSINYLETAAFRKSLLLEYNASAPSNTEHWIFDLAHRAEQVVHIPFVLQHRKAQDPAEKQRMVRQHAESARSFLQGQGFGNVEARLEDDRPRFQWTSKRPLVSIIIPTKNNLYYLRKCITSLLEKTTYPAYEILLMDDHSTDAEVLAYYHEIQAACPCLHVYENEDTFNYSRVNNHGARIAGGELLLFLNNDVEILEVDWLDELVRWTSMPGVGITGAKLLYPDQTIQHAGIVIGMTGHANHVYAGQTPGYGDWFVSPDDYRNVSAVTGACMMVRRDVFEQIGGFNENFLLVFNDVEICLRALHSGYRVMYTPAARLIHYEGRSRARYIPPQDIRLGGELLSEAIQDGDAYYNPNLSLAVHWPTLSRRDEPEASSRLARIVVHKSERKSTL